MKKMFAIVYGVTAFLLFNAIMIYFMVFISPFFEPPLMDSGAQVPLVQALLINLGLLAVFGLQHSVMARPTFKQWWLKIVPTHLERSTYVWAACFALLLLCWQWQPLPMVIWQVDNPLGYWVLVGLFVFGWLFSLYATFLIDSFDLIGLRQIYLYWHEKPYTSPPFQVVSVYKYIRHPIMLGTLTGIWATPFMSLGHLLLAMIFTLYVFIAIYFEERNLVDSYGEPYQKYQQETSKMIPFVKFV